MIETLGNLGEFIGAIGVILSLLYLSIQIRHNTKTVRASSYQAITSHLADINRSAVDDPEFAKLLIEGTMDLGTLSEVDRYRFGVFLSARLRHYENIYFHYSQGLLDSEVWDAHREVLAEMMVNPGVAAIWRSGTKAAFPAAFAKQVDSMLPHAQGSS